MGPETSEQLRQAMDAFSPHAFAAALALAGLVIIVSALLSGVIQRIGLPQVAIFLALGAALGPTGLGMLDIGLESPALRVVATLSLALVLFTDAVGLNVRDLRRHGGLAVRVVGPGTVLSAGVIAAVAWSLLGLTPPQAAILGAALASTDPVLLRGLLHRNGVPSSARHALQLESGLNDAVLLPVVLVAMQFLSPHEGTGDSAGRLFLQLFVLGPGAGVAVGLLAVAALDMVRRKVGVRRDYESLYSLGVAFTAFAAAESVHGSGFLGTFAAGLTVAALDVDLCDCFLEYGAVTAEMLLLFTFVLFGSSLIWSGFSVLSAGTLLFAALVLLARVPLYLVSLIGSGIDRRSQLLIAWFGPRALSSLLLVLLPIFGGLPGAAQLFPICCLVVLVSVVVHGFSPLLLEAPAVAEKTSSAPDDAATCPTSAPQPQDDDPKGRGSSMTLDDLQQLRDSGAPVILLDVRTARTRDTSDSQAAGSRRLSPEQAVQGARDLGLPPDAWLVAYCA